MAGIQAAGWLGVAPDHPFGLQTLPYGTFTTVDRPTEPRTGVAIGDRVLDLSAAAYRLVAGRADLFSAGYLNTFLDAGDMAWAQIRAAVTTWLSSDEYREAIEDLLVPAAQATSLDIALQIATEAQTVSVNDTSAAALSTDSSSMPARGGSAAVRSPTRRTWAATFTASPSIICAITAARIERLSQARRASMNFPTPTAIRTGTMSGGINGLKRRDGSSMRCRWRATGICCCGSICTTKRRATSAASCDCLRSTSTGSSFGPATASGNC